MRLKASVIACALLCWQGVGWGECYATDSVKFGWEKGYLDKKFDTWFNGGQDAKRRAEEKAEYAKCRAFEESLFDMCRQVIRSRVDTATVTFLGSGGGTLKVTDTDNGYRVQTPWKSGDDYYATSCYADKTGNLLRVVMDR